MRPHCVHPHTFPMWPQIFMLSVEAFHIEVGSWSGVAGEIWEGRHIYLFDGMVPQPIQQEIIMDSRKHLVEEEL